MFVVVCRYRRRPSFGQQSSDVVDKLCSLYSVVFSGGYRSSISFFFLFLMILSRLLF